MSGDSNLPTPEEREMYLKKIREWHELGFDTENLESLLDSDFAEFKRRRLQILKSQMRSKEDTIAEARQVDAPPRREVARTEPRIEHERQPSKPKESLILLGEPIEVEEPEEGPRKIEEAVIEVGRPSRIPSKKTRAARAADRELEKAVAVEPIETVDRKDVKFKIMDLKEGDVEREEEESEEEEEEEEEEYEEEKPRARPKKRRKAPARAPPPSNKGKAIVIAIVVIIAAIAGYYIYFIENDGDGNGTEPVEVVVVARITVQPQYTDYNAGEIVAFDAIDSEGDITDYLWEIDNDFKVKSGGLNERSVTGYFSPNENNDKEYTVTLTVKHNNDAEDSADMSITVKPLSVTVTPEKLGDYGDYKVTGFFDMTNPDGIVSFKSEMQGEEVEIVIWDIHIGFKTEDNDPMNMILKDAPNTEDGFWQRHSTYKRQTQQNLDLSGEVKGSATHPIFPAPYEFTADIDGRMDSEDEAYTDYKTLNTVKTYVNNDINLSITIDDIPVIGSYDLPMASHNELRSYPDLRKEPQRFRLEDLSDEAIQLGHTDAVKYGSTIYIWNAEGIDFVYNNPAIKVNLTLDSSTMSRLNLDDFFMNVWVAEDISLPVKTYIYIESTTEGNTTTIVHQSVMTDYTAGTTDVPDTCSASAPGGGHFYKKVPGMVYENETDWEYLPSKGQGKNSFNAYPPEQAVSYAESDSGFTNFKTSHPNLYVVNGYCSGIGGSGIQGLFWNLTFADEGSKQGYNIIVDSSGISESSTIDISKPPNSTSDFDPLLTFAGSEQILLNLSDTEIDQYIFKNSDSVDFGNVSYGVQADVAYPTIDITSVNLLDSSRYCFYIQNPANGYTVAVDAETGQLLFTLKSTSSGYELLP